jgi:hypothetical protein
MIKRIFTDIYLYFTLIIAVTFILIKIPHLSLTYYGDEALTAARMHEAGSIIYNSGLFYLSEGLWMKIFGTGLIAAKSFPLLLSILLLFSIYFFCKKFFSRLTGLAAVIIFSSQGIFLAQSSFVLPEVLFTLLTIAALYFYFSIGGIGYSVSGNVYSVSGNVYRVSGNEYRVSGNEYRVSGIGYSVSGIGYIISAILLSLTKESGLILVIILFLMQLGDFIRIRNYELGIRNKEFKNLVACFIPILLISVYYIIQKQTFISYLYPEHKGFISFTWSSFRHNLFDVQFTQLCLESGKNIMSLFLIISIVFYLFKSIKPEPFQKRIIFFMLLFIIIFLIFCSINSVSSRCILCTYPIYIILCSYVIITAFREYKYISAAILITVIFIKIHNTYTEKSDSDTNLGYINSIVIHKKAVEYCENKHLQDKIIYTDLLMKKYLTSPSLGYLSDKNKVFRFVTDDDKDFKKADYCILSSPENNPKQEKLKKENKPKLIYSVHKGQLWAEVYRIKE